MESISDLCGKKVCPEKAVVFWHKEKKASIVSLDCVPESSRRENQEADVTWKSGKRSKSFRATVLKISSDPSILNDNLQRALQKIQETLAPGEASTNEREEKSQQHQTKKKRVVENQKSGQSEDGKISQQSAKRKKSAPDEEITDQHKAKVAAAKRLSQEIVKSVARQETKDTKDHHVSPTSEVSPCQPELHLSPTTAVSVSGPPVYDLSPPASTCSSATTVPSTTSVPSGNQEFAHASQHVSFLSDLADAPTPLGPIGTALESAWGHGGGIYQPRPTYQHDQDQWLRAEQEWKEERDQLWTTCQRLQEENNYLKEKVRRLENSNPALLECDITPGKVNFLKRLTGSLAGSLDKTSETKTRKSLFGSEEVNAKIPSTETTGGDEASLLCAGEHVEVQVEAIRDLHKSPAAASEPSASSSSSTYTPSATCPNQDSEPVEMRPLTKEFPDVLISTSDLSSALLLGSDEPSKVIGQLLSILCTEEQLAYGKALGQRNAANATTSTTPLPANVVRAIKQFILQRYRKEGGVPVLKEKEFNTIINAKCGTVRRRLNKQKQLSDSGSTSRNK